jgi:hypothetical protein
LVVQAGQGSRFPAAPFNATVWPANSIPTPLNAEIVRVTNISVDTFTIARAQESTVAQSVINGYQIAQTLTAALLTEFTNCSGVPAGAMYAPSGYQSIPSAVTTGITGMIQDFVRGGVTFSANNLIVPVTGIYQIDGAVYFPGAAASVYYQCICFAGVSQVANGTLSSTAGGYVQPNFSRKVLVTAGTGLNLSADHDAGSNQNVQGGSMWTYLSLALVSS